MGVWLIGVHGGDNATRLWNFVLMNSAKARMDAAGVDTVVYPAELDTNQTTRHKRDRAQPIHRPSPLQ